MDFEVMESYLTGEYKDTFSRVRGYGAFKDISSDEMNERLEELYDILYTAQNQKKDVKKIVGNDLEKFCKDFFGDYGILDRLKKIPALIYKACWITFIFSLISILSAVSPIKNLFKTTDDMAGILIGAMIIFITDFVCAIIIAPLIPKVKKIKSETWSFIALGFTIVVFICVFVAFNDISIKVKAFYVCLISLIYILAYLAVTLTERYKRFGTIKNVSKAMKKAKRERAPIDLNLKKSYLEGSLTRFRRLVKRGKTDEFGYIETLRKDKKMYANSYKIYYAVGLLCGGFCFIETAITESILDALIFGLILFVILWFIMRFFVKFDRDMVRIVSTVIEEYEFSQLGFTEYVKLVADNKIGAELSPDDI